MGIKQLYEIKIMNLFLTCEEVEELGQQKCALASGSSSIYRNLPKQANRPLNDQLPSKERSSTLLHKGGSGRNG